MGVIDVYELLLRFRGKYSSMNSFGRNSATEAENP
jgi:hypothetical protein